VVWASSVRKKLRVDTPDRSGPRKSCTGAESSFGPIGLENGDTASLEDWAVESAPNMIALRKRKKVRVRSAVQAGCATKIVGIA
jgi:hypothetical protein